MAISSNLLNGYHRFRDGRSPEEIELYRALATKREPHTLVVSCTDGRVEPAVIFSTSPGELFVVRNVAALVPACEEITTSNATSAGASDSTAAAIEFAVTVLKVRNIVVLGHGACGGIEASLAVADNRPVGHFVGRWVGMLSSVRDELLEREHGAQSPDLQQSLEQLAIQKSIDNLLTFPFVSEAVNAGALSIDGAWFSIAESKLKWLDQGRGVFEDVPTAI